MGKVCLFIGKWSHERTMGQRTGGPYEVSSEEILFGILQS